MGIWTFFNPLNWFGRKRNGLRLRVRAELYEGDVHPVVDVEGIGPAYERQLADVGILNTDQLLAHPAASVAAAIDTPEKRVRSWQAMAELAVVDGIGPQYAEALARGGVDGIRDLVARDAKVISSEVNAHLDSLGVTVTGGKVSETRIRTWQKAAEGMRRRRTTVRLFGEALPPVSKQALRDRQAPPAGGVRTATAPKTAPTPGSAGKPATRKPATKTTTKTPARAPAKAAAKAAPSSSPKGRCAATTAAGSTCKRASRDGSKYCASHKGYRPAAAAKAAPATRVTVSKTPAKATATTKPATARKTTSKAAASTGKTAAKATTTPATGKVHVTHNGYRLYQKGNRFYFSKKTQAEVRPDGAEPVYQMPAGREVKVTQNGLPVLKSK